MRVMLKDGTRWPDPNDDKLHNAMWRANHHPESLTPNEARILSSVCEAYTELINHPAYTLKKVSEKVSMIRKAIKEAR